MAQLRDTVIQGSARVTDTLYANTINGDAITTSLFNATVINPGSGTYSTTITTGINYYNSSTLIGHIGATTSGTSSGNLGLCSSNTLVFRVGSTLNTTNNTFHSDYGINFDTISFCPKTTNTIALGTSSLKWSNLYATNIYGAIDTQVPSYTGSTAKTHYLTFITGFTAGQYQQYVSPYMKIYETPTSGVVTKTNIVIGAAQVTSPATAGVPGGITLYSGNAKYGHIATASNLTDHRTYTLPDATGTIALTSDITASAVGLGNVENTALSTWSGTSNITTLGTITTGVWNGTTIAVANGGTGATSAADARTNLGLGSIATYNNDYFLSLRGISTVASGTDIDTIKTMGNYYQGSNHNVTNQQHLPRGKKAFTLKIYYGSGYNSDGLYMHQLYQAYDNLLHFERRTNSQSVYGDWYYSPIAQAIFSVNATNGNHEYTLTKGSSSLPVYINSDGEIQPVSSLTPGGIVYGDASGAYASTAAGSSGQYLKSNGSNAPTWETLIGTSATSAAAGNHGHGNINNDGTCGSANRIIVTNSSQQMTTTAQLQYDISNSTLTASGTIATKVLNVGPPSEAYANSLTGGINFYYDNSTNSTIRAHIGSTHSQDADVSLFGLYATGAIVVRPGAAYDSTNNRISTTAGVKFTSTTIEPSITDSTSLGTSTLKWSNIYSTTATLNGLDIIGGDLIMSEASGHGATHKLIFQRGTATDAYSNWKLYNDSVGVLTLQVYHNGLTGDTDIIEILPPTNGGQIPTVQPGTTDSYKLGTSSLQWLSTYSKQFIVDTHVTLVYNSSDLSLNFNFS